MKNKTKWLIFLIIIIIYGVIEYRLRECSPFLTLYGCFIMFLIFLPLVVLLPVLKEKIFKRFLIYWTIVMFTLIFPLSRYVSVSSNYKWHLLLNFSIFLIISIVFFIDVYKLKRKK